MARNKLTADEADRRIQAQMTNEQRAAFADRVIWNNGTAADLERAVRASLCVCLRRLYVCVLGARRESRRGLLLTPPNHQS